MPCRTASVEKNPTQVVETMKNKKATLQPVEPAIEYVVVEDEFNILDEVFDVLFEQIEKEIRGTN